MAASCRAATGGLEDTGGLATTPVLDDAVVTENTLDWPMEGVGATAAVGGKTIGVGIGRILAVGVLVRSATAVA